MSQRFLHLILLFWTSLVLSAQTTPSRDFIQQYDHALSVISGFEVKDALLLSDAKTLALVGEKRDKSGLQYAEAYLFDTEKGALVDNKPPIRIPNCRINSISQADDGSLFLAGVMLDKSRAGASYLAQFDRRLSKKKWQLESGLAEGAEILKVLWLGCGSAMVAVKDAPSASNIRIYQLKGRKLVDPVSIGQDDIQNFSAMLPVPGFDNKVWLAGTAARKRGYEGGDAWVAQLDTRGMVTHPITYPGDEKNLEYINCATVSNETGQVFMAGWAQRNSEICDPLLLTPSGNANSRRGLPFYEKTNANDYISAVSNTAAHGFLFLKSTDNRGLYQHELRYSLTGNDAGREVIRLQGPSKFMPVALLRDSIMDEFYLVGTTLQAGTKTAQARVVKVKENWARSVRQRPVPKGAKGIPNTLPPGTPPKLVCQGAVLKEIYDENPDSRLSANESAAIWFTIRNDGGDFLGPAQAEVRDADLRSGISISDMSKMLPGIPNGGTHIVKIGIEADAQPAYGSSIFRIAITQNSTVLCECSSPAISSGKVEGKVFSFRKPMEEVNGGREQTERDVYQAKIYVKGSAKEVPHEQVVVKLNGEKPKRGQKDYFVKVENETAEGYFLVINIPLNEGENKLLVEYGAEISSEVTIFRKKPNPNIYVLSIGVPYEGEMALNYTTKDAQDFADAMRSQASRGFFGNLIYLRLLNTPENTIRDSIALAFEQLAAQEMDTSDYVFIFISAHGLERLNRPYIVPRNYGGNFSSCVDYQSMLDQFVLPIKARRFIFIDACHSGAGKNIQSINWENVPWQKETAPNLAAFFSSQGTERSYEYEKGQNGVFTQAILDAIAGLGLPADKPFLNISELTQYLSRRVAQISEEPEQKAKKYQKQTPKMRNNGLPDNMPVFGILRQ
jgi:hypothetical protein